MRRRSVHVHELNAVAAHIHGIFSGIVPRLREHPHTDAKPWRAPTEDEVTEVRLGEPIDFEILWSYVLEECIMRRAPNWLEKYPGGVKTVPSTIKWGIIGSWTTVEYFPDGLIKLWGASDEDWREVVGHVKRTLGASGCLCGNVREDKRRRT